MNNLKHWERLQKIHHLIKTENTGTPEELSKKLRVSIRLTYLLLEQLREMDAPLFFNRRAKTYFYKSDFHLNINISIQVLADDKLINIYAGQSLAKYIHSLQGKCSGSNYLSYIKARLDVAG